MKKSVIAILAAGIFVAANAQTKDLTTMEKNNTDSTAAKLAVVDSIANGVKNGYLLIENGVVKGYKTIENGVVTGFTSISDTLTVKLFGKKGETLEETKARLNAGVEKSKAIGKKYGR